MTREQLLTFQAWCVESKEANEYQCVCYALLRCFPGCPNLQPLREFLWRGDPRFCVEDALQRIRERLKT